MSRSPTPPVHPPNRTPRPPALIAQYRDPQEYARHLPLMIQTGYQLVTIQTVPGHVNWGRTLLRIILTGGLGIFFPSRTQPKFIATYITTHAALDLLPPQYTPAPVSTN